MSILTHNFPTVNPTFPTTDADAADRLAWHNDSPDNDYTDGYPGPGWQDDASEPTSEDDAHETGYQIGLTSGQMIGVLVAFPDASPALIRSIGMPFTAGRNDGIREFARRAGHALGLAGKPCVRPTTLNAYFDREFVLGWDSGATEKADREAEMARYFERLDWEHCKALEDRELEKLAREAGGWDRLANVALI